MFHNLEKCASIFIGFHLVLCSDIEKNMDPQAESLFTGSEAQKH